jgi:hypothetical protein
MSILLFEFIDIYDTYCVLSFATLFHRSTRVENVCQNSKRGLRLSGKIAGGVLLFWVLLHFY